MVWGKRAFSNADFGPYHELLLKLLYANPSLYREFMMVSTKTDVSTVMMYYVGVPLEEFTTGFDEFQYVPDEGLPRVIDTVIVADVESEEFITRFRCPTQTAAANAVAFLDDDEVYR